MLFGEFSFGCLLIRIIISFIFSNFLILLVIVICFCCMIMGGVIDYFFGVICCIIFDRKGVVLCMMVSVDKLLVIMKFILKCCCGLVLKCLSNCWCDVFDSLCLKFGCCRQISWFVVVFCILIIFLVVQRFCCCNCFLSVVIFSGRCMVLCVCVCVSWKVSCGVVGRFMLLCFRVMCVVVKWCNVFYGLVVMFFVLGLMFFVFCGEMVFLLFMVIEGVIRFCGNWGVCWYVGGMFVFGYLY